MKPLPCLVLALFAVIAASPLIAAPAPGVDAVLSWRVEYDAQDRTAAVVDPAGRATRFGYEDDEQGRLRRLVRTSPDGAAVTRDLDERGRLVAMRDGAGTVGHGYDDLGRLNRVAREGMPAIAYTHDTLDRIKTLQVGDFYRVEYHYDFLGRLESIDTPAGAVRYEYLTGEGKVLRQLPNGVATVWQSAPDGTLEKIAHLLRAGSEGSRYTTLSEYGYSYRPDGLIEAVDERSSAGETRRTYQYDQVGRLVRAKGAPRPQYVYGYDPVGNRTQTLSTLQARRHFAYDWAGRLSDIEGNAATQDAAGNLTDLTLGGKTWRYRFDADNRLAEIVGAKVAYRYDGDGNLIERSVGGVRTTFVPDPLADAWRPLVIDGGAGGRTLMVWDGAVPLMVIRPGGVDYLLHDHLGSVRLVADGRGKIARRIDYEPFGVMEDAADAQDFAPRFAGLFWDPVAEVYLTRARAYSPMLGRFLQIDPQHRVPMGAQQDFSLYAYCGNDPLNLVDPDGYAPQQPPSQRRWDPDDWDKIDPPLQPDPLGDAIILGVSAAAAQGAAMVGRLAVTAGAQAMQATAQRAALLGSYLLAASRQATQAVAQRITTVSSSINEAGRLRGSPSEPVHLPLLPDRIRYALGNPHYGESVKWGPHVAAAGAHLYRSHFFHPQTGAVTWAEVGGTLAAGAQSATATALPLVPAIKSALQGLVPDQSRKPDSQPDRRRPLGVPTLDRRTTAPPLPPSGGAGGSVLATSPVGSVYLGGSGQALEGIGLLDGIALDDNNNLILLDQGGQKIDLPPLRLDDLVTVFRSVYLYGEAPSVSIDPNPEDPEGSAMSIRHGTATAATYVGWVLFQADRLMKGYTLGADNDTAKDIKTGVPGYDQVCNTLFFGGGMPKKGQKGGHWERFWIVPAQTNRFSGDRVALTLFDVPLKVKTQSMKWEDGKLVDDTGGKSSPGATVFTDWFAKHYEEIAGERFLLPPPESGLTKPVPVFTELQRIALMTAIAEKLRDQGVPLPFWMRDYQVTPVAFERFTPAMEVTRSKGQVVAKVFGGVNLAAEDRSVRSFDARSDLAALGAPERERVRKELGRATTLGTAVRTELRSAEPLAVRRLDKVAGDHSAVALPGAQTQALAPARLNEADLSLPIAGGQVIRLVRSYNSFFSPEGPWGKGWALDLPRLEEGRVPVHREGDVTSFQTVYEAVTPLNSTYTRFSRIEPILALDSSRLMVPDAAQVSEFHGLADVQASFLSGPTTKLIRKDGGAWHFDKAGNLVATEAGGVRVIYERDAKGRPTRILGLLGRQPVASIDLAYNAAGLLESASATREGEAAPAATVRYAYDASGRLAAMESDAGRLGYRYQGPWVTAVTFAPMAADPGQDPAVRTFEYDARGRLLREIAADGTATDYRVAVGPDGPSLTVVPAGGGAETVRYDGAFRPVAAKYADGTGAAWRYPNEGGTILDLEDGAGNPAARVMESADGRHRTLSMEAGPQITSEHDEAGHLTALAEGGQTLLEQNWAPDGRLRTAKTESQTEHYEYDADGLVTRVLQTPPGAGERFDTWQATRLDPFGRPLEVKDSRGLDLTLGYDGAGRLQKAVSRQRDETYGVELTRDGAGRIEAIAAPSGKQSYRYDPNGLLASLQEEKGGATALSEWGSGLLRRVRQFDGGVTTLAYYDDKARAGLLKTIVAPNDLALNYGYDADDRLTAVDVGGRSRLVLDYDGQGRLAGWRHQAAGSRPPGN